MPKRPELIQMSDLRPEHFNTFPVWMSCDSFDYDEEWFDDTDEETFRPWNGELPVNPADGMFLVRATITLQDGSELPGFITPQTEIELMDLGIIQPQVFLPDGTMFGFWFGMLGCKKPVRDGFYRALRKSAAQVFPARFVIDSQLSLGRSSGEIDGFYASRDLKSVTVET
jgi:hypothetical protein